MTSPTRLDPVAQALSIISAAAETDAATATNPDFIVYTAAGVTGLQDGSLAGYNSALNSAAITGSSADTTAEVQSIVDAYNAVHSYTHWLADAVAPKPTAAQYAAIGVTGIAGSVKDTGTALSLLNDSVYGASPDKTDTVAELQAIANAANHVMAAAGGTATQAVDLSLQDLSNLGISGVTGTNLAVVQNLIRSVSSDAQVDTTVEIQALINAKIGSSLDAALAAIRDAAQNNTASTKLDLSVYAAAGVTGLMDGNLASYNSALNSAAVNGAAADTTAEVQNIVNAFNKIAFFTQAPADASLSVPTAADYAAIGVTGLHGAVTDSGTALSLMNQALFRTDPSKSDTVPELQALANAANHVMAAAGGTAAQSTTLSLQDFKNLGITGVTAGNLATVRSAIHAVASDTQVDTVSELQAMADAAAQVMTSGGGFGEFPRSSASLQDFEALGITGVTADNLSQIQVLIGQTTHNTNLDTLPELQQAIDAVIVHPVIIEPLSSSWAVQQLSSAAENNSASGHAGSPGLSVGLYTAAGVTGVTADNVNAINSALDSSYVNGALTDTTVEVQTLVDSYNAILHSADGVGGNTVAPLTAFDYSNIGVTGVAEGTDYIIYDASPMPVPLGLNAPEGNPGTSPWTSPEPAGISYYTREGSGLHLLNDVVDSFAKTAVDTVPELQAIADAANHIIAAAGGTLAAARAISHSDLFALGISYGDESSITKLQDALHALTSSAAVDTRDELANLAQRAQLTVFTDVPIAPVDQPQPDQTGCIDLRQFMQPSVQPIMIA